MKPKNSTNLRTKVVRENGYFLGAVLKMKQCKMLEKELNKIEGM